MAILDGLVPVERSEMTRLFLRLIARDYWDRLRWWDGRRHHGINGGTHCFFVVVEFSTTW